MCIVLMFVLELFGGVVDFGCGIGVFVIVVVKFGWVLVVVVDCMDVVVEVVVENVVCNGVEVEIVVVDFVTVDVPFVLLLFVNVLLFVHECFIAVFILDVCYVIVFGIVIDEVEDVIVCYVVVGYVFVNAFGMEDEWLVLLMELRDV